MRLGLKCPGWGKRQGGLKIFFRIFGCRRRRSGSRRISSVSVRRRRLDMLRLRRRKKGSCC